MSEPSQHAHKAASAIAELVAAFRSQTGGFPSQEHYAVDVQAAIDEAVKDRDIEWWAKLVCVDNVPPTPESAHQFILDVNQHFAKEELAEKDADIEKLKARIAQLEMVIGPTKLPQWIDQYEKLETLVARMRQLLNEP